MIGMVLIYTESGILYFNTNNSLGCDSTATLNLTINNSSSSTDDVIACDSYEWNDSIYTEWYLFHFSTPNWVKYRGRYFISHRFNQT